MMKVVSTINDLFNLHLLNRIHSSTLFNCFSPFITFILYRDWNFNYLIVLTIPISSIIQHFNYFIMLGSTSFPLKHFSYSFLPLLPLHPLLHLELPPQSKYRHKLVAAQVSNHSTLTLSMRKARIDYDRRIVLFFSYHEKSISSHPLQLRLYNIPS